MCVQGEVSVSRDREVVHSQSIQRLISFQLVGNRPRRADLGEAVRDEENEDNEEAVSGTLDLEVAEEGVGTEEVEGLVNDVSL